jgi:hypothetical protein
MPIDMLMTSSISIVMHLCNAEETNNKIILLGARYLFLLQSIQTSSNINKTFIFQGHHWIKQPGHAAGHSPPSTAKVNNEWSYTSTPHINGMHMHDFTFNLTRDLKHCNISVKNNPPQCSSSLKVTGHT